MLTFAKWLVLMILLVVIACLYFEIRPPYGPDDKTDPIPLQPILERLAKAKQWRITISGVGPGSTDLDIPPYVISDPEVIRNLLRLMPTDVMAEGIAPPDSEVALNACAYITIYEDLKLPQKSTLKVRACSSCFLFRLKDNGWLYGMDLPPGQELYRRLRDKDFNFSDQPESKPNP